MKYSPFIYSLAAYAIGMGGLTVFILFTGGWSFMPFHVDSPASMNSTLATAIDLALVTLFAVQHSVMARPAFKARWTKIIPASCERATYTLVSGVLMVVISILWQPIEGTIWHVDSKFATHVITGMHLLGWTIAIIATFLIDHFELFGLKQAWTAASGKPATEPPFTDSWLYKVVRHPLQLGIFLGIWIAPTMSAGHLLLSVSMTVYIFIGLYFEEKDLMKNLGEEYVAYQQRVPKLIPFTKLATSGAKNENQ